jgi:hypothetical protein
MNRFCIAFLCMAAGWPSAQAPGASVKGAVSDVIGPKLPDVKVTLKDTKSKKEYSAKDKTDGNGAYQVDQIPPGEYAILMERPGYQQLAPMDPIVIKDAEKDLTLQAEEGSMWKRQATKKYLEGVSEQYVKKVKQGKQSYERLWFDTRVVALLPSSKQYLIEDIVKKDDQAKVRFEKFNLYLKIAEKDLLRAEGTFRVAWVGKGAVPAPSLMRDFRIDDEVVVDILLHQKATISTSPLTMERFFEQFNRTWMETKAPQEYNDWLIPTKKQKPQ